MREPGAASRRLIWIPIVHTQDDMGGLRESVRRHYIERHGLERWEAHVRAVEAFWDEVRRTVLGLEAASGRLKLYQDGLPVCGKEEAIVRDLAASGSRNHRLLVELIGRGAELVGTESPELLVEEYRMAVQLMGGASTPAAPDAAARFEAGSRALLERRDRFIAGRVDATLEPGRTGLIFLGLLHRLDGLLPPDVELVRLSVAPEPAGAPGN